MADEEEVDILSLCIIGREKNSFALRVNSRGGGGGGVRVETKHRLGVERRIGGVRVVDSCCWSIHGGVVEHKCGRSGH